MKRLGDHIPLVASLSVLSDGVRLRMLRLLEKEELSVGEVAKVVQLPQSTVSRHLKALADAAWLGKRTEGTATLYRLILDDLDNAMRSLWVTVRTQIEEAPPLELAADLRRLGHVIEGRRTDSRTFFGRVAAEWQSLRSNLFGEGFTGPGLLALINPEWIVADLGCGSGDAARLLAPHVKRVLAIDQSEAMLENARGLLGAHNNVELVCGDLESVPLPDACADAAVLSLVLHHVGDPSVVLAEASRLLRNDTGGGVAIVIDMLAHDREEYRRTMGHVHLGFTPDDIRSMFMRAGFRTPRIHELPTNPEAKGPGLFVASARLDETRD